MNWFDQLKNALAAYYPPGQPGDIVGYLQGSASPMIWRSMALGDRPRNQMMILGSLPPTQEAWVAAGVAQRDQIQVIRFAALNGFIVLYGGFVLRPWGKIFESSHDRLTQGFSSSLDSWRRNYMPPRG